MSLQPSKKAICRPELFSASESAAYNKIPTHTHHLHPDQNQPQTTPADLTRILTIAAQSLTKPPCTEHQTPKGTGDETPAFFHKASFPAPL
ncbi:MAG: hypothetical protein NZ739_11155, partial [Verrucomicrobiae bacterium]|nr:hypothetical protein [Verrucomicrobiae bacterium]